jgi:hypothetical protein
MEKRGEVMNTLSKKTTKKTGMSLAISLSPSCLDPFFDSPLPLPESEADASARERRAREFFFFPLTLSVYTQLLR